MTKARLEDRLLALKPGDILYMTRDEYHYFMEKAMAVTADIAKREAERDPLLVEREKTHGSFQGNAKTFCALKAVFNDSVGPLRFSDAHNLAVEMILLKLARLRQNPTEKDHWLDIAGYAKLGAEACDNG